MSAICLECVSLVRIASAACVAAGLATLRVLRNEPIHARAEALATRLNQGLTAATALADEVAEQTLL